MSSGNNWSHQIRQTNLPIFFYNRELACLVVVELKDGPFQTSFLGQLAGYLRILDDEVRKPNENPSIGIILCKSANKKFVATAACRIFAARRRK